MPTFRQTSNGLYDLVPTVLAKSGDNYIYDVSSVAGICLGDELDHTAGIVGAGTTVSSIGTLTYNTMGCSSGCGRGDTTIDVSSTYYTSLRIGMTITDGPVAYSPNCTGVAQSAIPNNTTITAFSGTNSVVLSNGLTQNVTNADCITVSGGNVLFLSAAATGSTSITGVAQRVWTGVYRLVGALYTGTGTTPPVVAFTQDGDTFYLQNSVRDIVSALGPCAIIGTTSSSCALSVPCGRATCTQGIKVEALGRVVGSNELLITSFDQADQAPSTFPGGPAGFDTNSTSTTTSFPFRLYTNTTGQVRARSSSNTATSAYEVTDGWLLHR